jgi:hypothetical protein
MFIYEMILEIIGNKGPISIPSICQEMNQTCGYNDSNKLVQPSQIKQALSRKKDLFKVEDNLVSILPEKDPQQLTVYMGGGIEPSLMIKVDFEKNRFSFIEKHFEPRKAANNKFQPLHQCGSVEAFKRELYRIKPWEWARDYEPEEMVLDGIFWSVKLVTKAKVYESEGLQCFPKEWPMLLKGLSALTGFDITSSLR